MHGGAGRHEGRGEGEGGGGVVDGSDRVCTGVGGEEKLVGGGGAGDGGVEAWGAAAMAATERVDERDATALALACRRRGVGRRKYGDKDDGSDEEVEGEVEVRLVFHGERGWCVVRVSSRWNMCFVLVWMEDD